MIFGTFSLLYFSFSRENASITKSCSGCMRLRARVHNVLSQAASSILDMGVTSQTCSEMLSCIKDSVTIGASHELFRLWIYKFQTVSAVEVLTKLLQSNCMECGCMHFQFRSVIEVMNQLFACFCWSALSYSNIYFVAFLVLCYAHNALLCSVVLTWFIKLLFAKKTITCLLLNQSPKPLSCLFLSLRLSRAEFQERLTKKSWKHFA